MHRLLLALSALLLVGVPALAAAQGSCTASKTDSSGKVSCAGGIPQNFTDGKTWEDWVKQLSDASTVDFSFSDIIFDDDGVSFQRMLDGVFGVGGSKTVQVTLKQCTMNSQEFESSNIVKAGGSTQYTFLLDTCILAGNQINITGAFAGQTNVNVALQVLGSVVKGNVLSAAGAAAVGATGTASVQIAEGSTVQDNKVTLVGALAVGADGSLNVQLSSANITGNDISLVGGMFLGGNGSLAFDDADNIWVSGNNSAAVEGAATTRTPLVASVLDILMGLGFDADAFNTSAALKGLQGQLCAALDGLGELDTGKMTAEESDLLTSIIQQVTGLMCDGSDPSSSFDLGSLAPLVEGLVGSGTEDLSQLLDGVLGEVLGSADMLQSLITSLLNNTANWQDSLEELLSQLVTSPAGDSLANILSDLLDSIGDWLKLPLGGSSGGAEDSGDSGNDSGSSDSGSSDSGSDGGSDSGSDDLPADSGSDDSGNNDGGFDLGSFLDGLLSGISDGLGGGGGNDDGGSNGEGNGQDDGGDGILGILDNLLGSLTGGGDGGSTTGGDLLNQLLTTLTGGDNSPLAGQDVTALIPALKAILSDEKARAALPSLISSALSGEQISLEQAGPLVSAVLADPEAQKQLPQLISLFNKLGISLGGGGGAR